MKNVDLVPDPDGKLVVVGAICIGRVRPSSGRRWAYYQRTPWREVGSQIYGEAKSQAAAVVALVDAAVAECPNIGA